jgi:hypothetical protein
MLSIDLPLDLLEYFDQHICNQFIDAFLCANKLDSLNQVFKCNAINALPLAYSLNTIVFHPRVFGVLRDMGQNQRFKLSLCNNDIIAHCFIRTVVLLVSLEGLVHDLLDAFFLAKSFVKGHLLLFFLLFLLFLFFANGGFRLLLLFNLRELLLLAFLFGLVNNGGSHLI